MVLARRGFFPEGQGRVVIKITPFASNANQPVQLRVQGSPLKVSCKIFGRGVLFDPRDSFLRFAEQHLFEAFGSILKQGILNWNFKFLLPLGRPKLHPNLVIPLTINITISLENMHVQVSLQTDSSINTFADSVSMATESGMNIFFCKIFIMNDPVTL